MNGTYYDFKQLKAARKKKYTQDYFAELLDVDVVTLSRMENGHIASYELIIRACQKLDLDSSEILYSSRRLVPTA